MSWNVFNSELLYKIAKCCRLEFCDIKITHLHKLAPKWDRSQSNPDKQTNVKSMVLKGYCRTKTKNALCNVQYALCNAMFWSKFDSWWRTCSIPSPPSPTAVNFNLRRLHSRRMIIMENKEEYSVLKRLGFVVIYQFWPWFDVKGTLQSPST